MQNEGPLLQTLTHRLAQCPPEFLMAPRIGGEGEIHVAAVVADLWRACDLVVPQNIATLFESRESNRLQIALVSSWLLYDAGLRNHLSQHIEYSKSLLQWLATDCNDLSLVVEASQFVSDADRREELVRRILALLDLRPLGETLAQAQSRLTTLDSIERQRVVLETRAAQQRAQAIREAMQEKARQEAAARYTRE